MIVLFRDQRVRPLLQTPAKGSVGDRCIESEVGETDIPTILRKYAGNLQELMAWRGKLSYGVQTPDNLQDLYQHLDHIKELYCSSGSELSFEDWFKDVLNTNSDLNKSNIEANKSNIEVNNNETNQSEAVHE